MARQVLPIAGAIIGGIYGGPSGAQAGYAIGSLVGNAVDPLVIKGPRIGDAAVQTSAEGVYRPVVFGTAAVVGNVIERGNRQIKNKQTGGGKGGPVNEEQRVYWTFAIRICEGPIAAILRVWEDEKLVYDIRPDSTIPDESAEFFARTRIYLGDEDQLPDPDIEAYRGVGNVPAYRGTAYIVFPNADLTDRRESIPNYRFEVSQIGGAVTPGTTMVLGKNSLGTGIVKFVSTADGLTYTGEKSIPGATNPSFVKALANDRFLALAPNTAQYSDDFGDTWSDSSDSFPGAGVTGAYADDDGVVIVPHGASGYSRSTDNGESFSRITTPWFNFAEPAQSGMIVAAGGYSSHFMWSSDKGVTFNEGGTHGISFAGGGCSFSVQGRAFFCGQLDGHPAVAATGNGASAIPDIVDVGSSLHLISGAGFVDEDGAIQYMVGGDDDGQAWYYDIEAAAFVPLPSFGANLRITSIQHNGIRYILGTDYNDDAGGGGRVFTSDDKGRTWTERTTALTNEVRSIASQPPVAPTGSGLPVPLSSIVTAIHARADASDFDASELTDMVDGVVLAGDYTCADSIKTLAPVYFFDAPEYDAGDGYKIRYRKRGAAAVRTLTVDDFVDIPDQTVRADSLERPRVLHMAFQSPTVGYAAAKASPARNSPDVRVVGEVALQVPIAFSSVDEAWQRADVMLKQTWAEVGGEEEFTISDAHIDLVPSDVVGVVLRDQVRRMRITETSVEPGQVRMKLLPDRQSAYTSNITGLELPAPTPPPPSVVGQTVLAVLDLPAITDTNDRLLGYIGMSGQTEAWYGALAQLSTNDGVSWQDAASTRAGTVMGTLVNDVSAASPYYSDRTNRVGVSLFSDAEIESLSEQQFLSEGGAFAISWSDSDGEYWEVLQYRDAEQDSDGVWWLSHLARGRLNTDAVAHSPGARVVFLDSVLSYDAVSAWIGTELEYRATSFGNSPDGSPILTQEYTGQSQREWPVAHLFLSRDGDVVTATTVPRHRFGTEDRPVRSINWQAYRWTATDGANTATQDTIGEAAAFNVAGWGSPVTVTVSQVNRITGAGPSVLEQIA